MSSNLSAKKKTLQYRQLVRFFFSLDQSRSTKIEINRKQSFSLTPSILLTDSFGQA